MLMPTLTRTSFGSGSHTFYNWATHCGSSGRDVGSFPIKERMAVASNEKKRRNTRKKKGAKSQSL